MAQESVPSVELFNLPSVESIYSIEFTKADAAISRAETEAVEIRQAAAAVRLKAYKDKLAEATKAGDLQKATAIKAKIDQIELEPEIAAKKSRPKDVVKFGGHSYALIKEPATWHVAKKRCEEMGGTLVCINSPKEEAFVASLAKDAVCYIGASDEETEGKRRNVDGSPAVFSKPVLDNWQSAEHWMSWVGEGMHQFADGGCATRRPYVCEWDH